MTSVRVAAVDLGATSGRVMVATVDAQRLELEEAHRFPNGAVQVGESLVWDLVGIHREVLAGLRSVARSGPLHGIGIDSWGVDYGLLDRDGELLGPVRSHRDRRTTGVADQVRARVPDEELYAINGLQRLPFNTVYQLVAARGTAALEAAETLLLVPDLLGFWLTGTARAERTNASTTGLLDVTTQGWSLELAKRLGLPWAILPPLQSAGDVVGPLRPDVAASLGIDPDAGAVPPLIAVGSHDTASAVLGVPAATDRFAYISSGTWSLIGLELDGPILSEPARLAGFTNEGGVDRTIRFLKNVMGLWVLTECVRSWTERDALRVDLPALLAEAAEAPPLRTVIGIDDARLFAPGSMTDAMPDRVATLAHEAGEPAPAGPVDTVRCILDSLALAYRRHLRTACALAGRSVDVVHVVGGGAQNQLLCQLTADACELPVLAGPSEAAALGNVLVQARALGVELPDRAAMRDLLRRTQTTRRYEPRAGSDWAAAEERLPPERGGRMR